ncbi:hypothetical protein AJ80_06412 [Polytolypa hystricis UAMH7299]|uniref:Uncharacterized protein n=1 Tax=Polytolypa hystricis (strain UAMH7299) TaxID=1447883 RepID=A0A2B7XVC9_POLH7|nr:hypothetical protein AJ80_06412 [Polytolypa hystricis UAMH7299]
MGSGQEDDKINFDKAGSRASVRHLPSKLSKLSRVKDVEDLSESHNSNIKKQANLHASVNIIVIINDNNSTIKPFYQHTLLAYNPLIVQSFHAKA